METLSIEILNPKVRGILKQLAELKLIAIKSTSTQQEQFKELIHKLRSIDPDGLSEMDIVAETEIVRLKRNEKKATD